MAKNKHSEKPVVADSSRRSFLAKLWIGLGLLALLQTAGVVVAYFRPLRKKSNDGEQQSIIKAGPAESFNQDSVTTFIRGKFYLARLDDGGFLALSRKCTHLGCSVMWHRQDKKFVCPCHSSEFDIRGEVLDPPATRALDAYRVSIENNVVNVDLGKRIKRSRFDRSHVVYPNNKYPA